MQFGNYLQIFSALAMVVGIVTAAPGGKVSQPASKDATILRSSTGCPQCPESNCYKCTLGHDDTLEASLGARAFVNFLVGFELTVPTSKIKECTVQFPAFTKPRPAPVNVTISRAKSSDWDEDTVNGENAPEPDARFASYPVDAYANMGALDITPACKAADDQGRFTIAVGTETGGIEIWSKDSGNPAILHVKYA